MSQTIQQDGDAKKLTAAVGTANTALPVQGSGGATPRRVLVSVEQLIPTKIEAAVAEYADFGAVVKLGDASVVVTVSTGVYIPAGGREILFCGGQARLAAIRVGSVDHEVHIVPLSD